MTRRRAVALTVVLAATAACSGEDASTTGSTAQANATDSTSGRDQPVAEPPSIGSTIVTNVTSNSMLSSSRPVDAPDSTVTRTAPPTVAPITTPTAAPTTAAPTDDPGHAVGCAASLPLRERAALLVWPGAYPSDWVAVRNSVVDVGVGGILLMNTGEWTHDELASRLTELDELSMMGVLVATDEEGGDVQRLSRYRDLPSQEEVSTTRTPAEASALIASHAVMVAQSGVDVVLGPVVDVAPESGDVPLQRSRFFTGGPDDVSAYAAAYVDGWKSAGLVPVLKHFPGHGAASGDTHLAAGVTPSLEQLENRDLIPYRELAGRGAAVMMGHLTVPGLTGGEPASRSPAAVAYLRETLGFADGLLISDALEMSAVGLSVPDAVVEAVAAGIDVVLFTDTAQTAAVVGAITQAVLDDVLPESRVTESAERVAAMLESVGRGC